MADFTQIIQEINDYINTNGVGAIKGAKLNEVLRDMIAAVNAEKQDPLTIDATPMEGSTNPVQSGGVYSALQQKPTIFFTPDIMNVPTTILNKVKVGDVIQYGDDAVTEVTVAVKDEQSDIIILVYNDGINVGGFQYQNGVCFDTISFALTDMANKVSGATDGNLAGLAANGDLTDSGIAASDVATTSDLADKLDAPSTAGTSGQVLTSDGQGGQSWQTPQSGVSSYNDLNDKPQINSVTLSGNKSASDLGLATAAQGTKADMAYQKPQSGIPSTDFAAAVQTSLGKADTAVQQVTVGTTTTGNAGTNAIVTNSGTATNPVLDFTIPRGADGQDGADAVNPFKGWWPDLATLKAAHTATEGDSAYVRDASPATTWSIYVYDATASSDNFWADSGIDADTSNVQTFATGEEVNQTAIDNDCHEGLATNVASAAVAKRLVNNMDKLVGTEYSETTYDIVDYFTTGGYYTIENNAPVLASSNNWKCKIIPIEQLVNTTAVAVGSRWEELSGVKNIPSIIYLSSDTPSAQSLISVQYGTQVITESPTSHIPIFVAIEHVSIPSGATHAIVNNSSVAGADATITIASEGYQKGIVTKLSDLIVKVDAAGNGDYETINDAINNTSDGDTIVIYPGVYEESVKMFGKNRHLVGICKDTCIITNGTGAYLTPPLEANIGSVENLTIIADNYAPTINDPSQDSSERGSYGIHIEYANATPYTLRISNCKILSKWSAGIGLGLRYNQTVKIENCELISECVRMYSQYINKWVEMGGIFFHNDASSGSSQGTGNLIIRDTMINGKKAAVTMEAVNTTPLAKALFVNTTCESEDYGVGAGIIYRFDNMETQEGYLCGNKIVLSQAAHGNNIQDFNA